ncbi:MAG: DedA family protein [Sulfurovum sp.]|nr:DedA family protein [Sulfurovum sp.]
MLLEIVTFFINTIGSMGYWGIFFLMFLESTFFPFPSEVVMIPSGYLVYKGEMNFYLVVFVGILGSVSGALFNYYFAMRFGRGFLLKYGKYFFVKPEILEKLEIFFQKHGEFSTFNGRLIPGIRQLISLPAGLARMNLTYFLLYSALGAAIWVIILVVLGYSLGSNEEMITRYLHTIIWIILIFVVFITVLYTAYQKRKRSGENNPL